MTYALFRVVYVSECVKICNVYFQKNYFDPSDYYSRRGNVFGPPVFDGCRFVDKIAGTVLTVSRDFQSRREQWH